jgi:hypothetical protein
MSTINNSSSSAGARGEVRSAVLALAILRYGRHE